MEAQEGRRASSGEKEVSIRDWSCPLALGQPDLGSFPHPSTLHSQSHLTGAGVWGGDLGAGSHVI